MRLRKLKFLEKQNKHRQLPPTQTSYSTTCGAETQRRTSDQESSTRWWKVLLLKAKTTESNTAWSVPSARMSLPPRQWSSKCPVTSSTSSTQTAFSPGYTSKIRAPSASKLCLSAWKDCRLMRTIMIFKTIVICPLAYKAGSDSSAFDIPLSLS